MNYAQARERLSPEGTPRGLWDWTVRNDDNIWRHACCREHSATQDGHPTQVEAERCHWEYKLTHVKFYVVAPGDADSLGRCKICRTFTASFANSYDGYGRDTLCPEHHTREALEQLHPFVAGHTEIYS